MTAPEIPLAQLARSRPETVIEWLIQRNEEHRAQLLAACTSLRAAVQDQNRSHRRLLALLANRTA
ncbi:hypothetical protein [Streptomyces sp. NPDC007991]|uniref:hypothetical protein n=1 Tax=Streptomyces sp. NPDC007991 TaxID=3364803 RepID=UPI0036EB6B10